MLREFLEPVSGEEILITKKKGTRHTPEQIVKKLRARETMLASGKDMKTLFIVKSSPWESGYIVSFNGKLRDVLLNREIFLRLLEARWVIDRWRLDCNHHRPPTVH